MAEMGHEPDHQRLAAEVLGIRNAPPDLARRLVAQALVVEDRREAWRRAGERICAEAPSSPGVYVLCDEAGRDKFGGGALAPIVFSWLAHRGADQSRIDPHDAGSPRELRARLAALLADEQLFAERIVLTRGRNQRTA